MKVGINGMGRIGRLAFRAVGDHPKLTHVIVTTNSNKLE